MKFISIITAFWVFTISVAAQDVPSDIITAYKAQVYKQDGSFMDVGILWEAQEEELILLPKSQYNKWKNFGTDSKELNFTKIKADNLKCLKLLSENKKRKSILMGLGIGAVIGLPIGIVRQSNYDREYCEDGDDPLWTKCIGGKNRIANNMLIGGILGGYVGLIKGSVKINIDLKNGVKSYEAEKQKIREYAILR